MQGKPPKEGRTVKSNAIFNSVFIAAVTLSGCAQDFERVEIPTAHDDYLVAQKNHTRVELSTAEEQVYQDAAAAFSAIMAQAENGSDLEILLAAFVDVLQYERHRVLTSE